MELDAFGFILKTKKWSPGKYLVHVLTQNKGKWSGIYIGSKNPPILSSYSHIKWSGKKLDSYGKIKIECLGMSPVLHHWQEPLVVLTISSICESIAKFIPDRVESEEDFNMLRECLVNINNENYLQTLIRWEQYLLLQYRNWSIKYISIKDHFDNTNEIQNDFRKDLLALLGYIKS